MTTQVEELAVRKDDVYERAYVLEDMHMRSDGSGRVVEAYAAAFGVRTEIMDQDGHYYEVLDPKSFDTTIATKQLNFGVLFNHGRTVDGAPYPDASMPIGVPIEVRSDERGVFTATRYLDNPIADWTLDAIKQGAIRGQSFSGSFRRSARTYPDGRTGGALPLITRREVAMREYGPAVFPAYTQAAILGTRADQFLRTLLATPPDRRLAFLEQFEGLATQATGPALPDLATLPGAGEMTDEPRQHSARSLRAHIRAARIARNMESA